MAYINFKEEKVKNKFIRMFAGSEFKNYVIGPIKDIKNYSALDGEDLEAICFALNKLITIMKEYCKTKKGLKAEYSKTIGYFNLLIGHLDGLKDCISEPSKYFQSIKDCAAKASFVITDSILKVKPNKHIRKSHSPLLSYPEVQNAFKLFNNLVLKQIKKGFGLATAQKTK